MNNRKNHNSALILAALGVYIGLVLVGGTPQVLAQAAMTRQFNVKDEVEFKDDLDNKPDDERTPVSDSVKGYLQDVEYFFANLSRLRTQAGFNSGKDAFEVAQATLLPCVDRNMAGRYTALKFEYVNESSRRALENFSRSMVYGYSLGDCIANDEFNGVEAVATKFRFKLDAKEFFVNISIKKQSPQNALSLLRELESSLKLYATTNNDKISQKIIANTSFRVESDQVFIVTRLPRAGLDSLLAVNA